MIDRRAFLGALPIAVFGAGRRSGVAGVIDPEGSFGTDPPPQLGAIGRVEGWGVQLYTVRNEMMEDADRTLAAIAEVGYTEVELAGLYGLTAREMRGKLDAVGLRATSSHHGLSDLRDDWERMLEDALELGQDLVVVPSIPVDERTAGNLTRVADDFNRAGRVAAGLGLRFGYHNHDWEFEPLPDGTIPMELLLERTDGEYVDWQSTLR